MDKVSVIIPLYNRKNLIAKTLLSLKQELHPSVTLDVVVVDDGSTDGGEALVLEQFPYVTLLKQQNQGAPTARNLGLKHSQGEYILFLDSDDLVEPNFFEKKINALKKHPEASGAYGLWEHFKESQEGGFEIIPRHTHYPIIESSETDVHLNHLLAGWYIILHAILWRRSSIGKINGFDIQLKINQDVDFLFQILIQNGSLVGVKNDAKALYRKHATGTVGDLDSAQKLKDIYQLRVKFISQLKESGKWDKTNRENLARYCFNMWTKYRKQYPTLAESFYKLSKSVYPKLKIKGGVVLSVIHILFNARFTYLIVDFLRNTVKSLK